ncbi:HAMP domain-containing sensor histidine kinase [Agrococcus sp. DT81.2]|uniref:HAMP domain-containing sensor histidine kinase n=1 Tax=Agrococcus sp. DT81.2 TaxID=3393414 RepID=UPI003CE5BE09
MSDSAFDGGAAQRRAPGLRARLLAAIALAVLVGFLTAWAVASAIGPPIFHAHLLESGTADPVVNQHAEAAFRTASGLSLALALVAAAVSSIIVSASIARRIERRLAGVRRAAEQVAVGDYAARAPLLGMGSEFDELAGAFNTMAADLAGIEAARTRMLSELAHEMRTPAAVLEAYLEAIRDGVVHADEPTIEMLRAQVARLTRLSHDIALVTTAEEGRLAMRRARLPARRLLEGAAAQVVGRAADADVRFSVDVAPSAEGALLDADVDRLGQVLTNLLDNALRHTPAGGHVRLGADRVGDRLRITVCDDGEGIPREHLPRIFDRFYRVDTARDRAHGGSGVGLSIVRSITEAHGGSVSARSDGLGRGAVFAVELPVVTDRHGAGGAGGTGS